MSAAPVPTEIVRTMWCGPYALAVVSGLTYDETYKKVLRKLRSMKSSYKHKPKIIKGMYHSELEAVGKTLKCPFEFTGSARRRARLTLNRTKDHLRPNRIYIVNVTDHYLVVNTSDWTMCDNWTKAWVPVKGSVHARKKVLSVAEVKRHQVF